MSRSVMCCNSSLAIGNRRSAMRGQHHRKSNQPQRRTQGILDTLSPIDYRMSAVLASLVFWSPFYRPDDPLGAGAAASGEVGEHQNGTSSSRSFTGVFARVIEAGAFFALI
jgi:hypothetical protein